MDVLQTIQDASPWILVILVASTALSHALQAGAHAFERFAITTPTPRDDEVARKLSRIADSVASFMDGLSRLLLRIGVRAKDDVQPPRRLVFREVDNAQ